MKTYPLTKQDGCRPFAFEIENTCISLSTIARLLNRVDGVTEVQPQRMFSKSSDVHIEFRYQKHPYIVWEPFGDNSRYWIGPKNAEHETGEIEVLEAAFKRYQPLIRRIVCDVSFFRSFTQFLKRKR